MLNCVLCISLGHPFTSKHWDKLKKNLLFQLMRVNFAGIHGFVC